jgi:hypothetical protein
VKKNKTFLFQNTPPSSLSSKLSHRPSTTTFNFARKKPLSNESPIEKLGRGFLLPYPYQPTSQSFTENKQTASGKDINALSEHH